MSIVVAAYQNDDGEVFLKAHPTSTTNRDHIINLLEQKGEELDMDLVDAMWVRPTLEAMDYDSLLNPEKMSKVISRYRDRPRQDTAAQFQSELRRAEKRFADSYVGLHYFITAWRGRNFSYSPKVRHTILDKLVNDGKVEIYESVDGSKAIRLLEATPVVASL